MTQKQFIEKCIDLVIDYNNENKLNTKVTENDVFIVWSCKTLQNSKALLGTTTSNMYYEITYNGDKDQIYFDAYKKVENRCIEPNILNKEM